MDLKIKGLNIACVAILATLIWLSEIYATEVRDKLNSVFYDLATITTSDFTIEVKLTETVWKKWLEHKESRPKNDKQRFRAYLRDKIEE